MTELTLDRTKELLLKHWSAPIRPEVPPVPKSVRCSAKGCLRVIDQPRRNARRHFCSSQCRSEQERREGRRANPEVVTGMASGTVGAIAELLVAADLMQRGYEVFRAVSPACSCDLAAIKNGHLWRIEVRNARRSKRGVAGFPFSPSDVGRHDVLALRFRDNTIEYRPPLDSLGEPSEAIEATVGTQDAVA